MSSTSVDKKTSAQNESIDPFTDIGVVLEQDESFEPSDVEVVALKHHRELGVTEDDIMKASRKAEALTSDEALGILLGFLGDHEDDILIPKSMIDRVYNLVVEFERRSNDKSSEKSDEIGKELRIEAAILAGNSVYPEVRAVCDPFDDPSMPCGTIRAWTLGLFWAMGIAAINQFFDPRQPTIKVSVYLVQILSYPMGKLWEKVMPSGIFFPSSRFAFTLNPGPFNQKEHMLITIMSNVTSNVPYVSEFLFVQRLPIFFGQEWAGSTGYQLCFILSTQFIGYGLAGICRRFLVYPPNMVWFLALGQATLNKAFHTNTNLIANGWKISRLKFFLVAFAGMFVYFWLPNSLFSMLTFFNWTTWIKPTSVTLSIITGTYYFNLGLAPLGSFDWNWISNWDPLVIPFFIVVQMVSAMLIWGICVIIPVFFTDTWWTGHLPINSFMAYSNIGMPYNMTKVVNENNELVQEKYENYSPVFLSAAVILRGGVVFATYFAVITFAALWHGKTIWRSMKRAFQREAQLESFTDIHSVLMRSYEEVPEWIYLAILLIAACLGFTTIYAWPTGVPGWTIPFGIISSTIFVIPLGIVAAITAYEPTLEIVSEVLSGIVCAGHPVSAFIFRSYGSTITSQAISFITDMKLGHYAKIPPKQMLMAQLAATFLSAFVTVGIVNFQIENVEGICEAGQKSRFICAGANRAFTSAILWGLVGPKRLFGKEEVYNKLPWFVLAGALWPVPFWLARRKWPGSWWRYCHPVAMMMGGITWAPINLSNALPTIPVAWVFGSYIKNRFLPWWSKYTYVLAAALTAGIALSAIVQFAALEYHPITIKWWGNTYSFSTCDWKDCRYIETDYKNGEKFGPKEWH